MAGGAAGHNKADVIQFAICRDLFRSCDDVMWAASNALDTAALRWAGDEMVSNVSTFTPSSGTLGVHNHERGDGLRILAGLHYSSWRIGFSRRGFMLSSLPCCDSR